MLIAIEGIDGSGKTSLARFLVEKLKELGYDAILLKEPTDSKWGKKIKESYKSRLSPEEELRLFLLDREYDVKNNIIPALESGKIVIMDRYYFSTIAYQGALGFDPDELKRMNEEIAPKPDLLIILDLNPEKALERIKNRDEPNEFERKEYLSRVREIFLSIEDEDVDILVVDANRDQDEIRSLVLDRVLVDLSKGKSKKKEEVS
ncbi:thymidylate kinase [Archaeoglobus sulfaticallidus PM70-1]|uniref:Probable thymidylate kinase n=1 Tax=Archaeoglobus sulfaticallidus PM70-1 TaxID=387631 RepID=N0BIG8_9EURY|nr:dTMP kinase [Archaeoglobus sulfaticallidus]AGK60261.1 thymidylate kinase [Archaeoglobus sulfaticallidus PM70-1]